MNDSDRHASVRLADLPVPNADWADIREFALTFEGYDYVKSRWPGREAMESCKELAHEVKEALSRGDTDPAEFSLEDLRAALFWHQRVVRWSTTEIPSDETLEHCRRLIECMRERVAGGA